MKKDFKQEIEIPEGIEASLDGKMLKMKKGNDSVEKKIPIEIKIDGKNIILEATNSGKKEKKMINTYLSHLKNMVEGLREKYEYHLQICAVHFPMNVSVDKTNSTVIIKNFLGEVKPRISKIAPNAEVKIEKDIISVSSSDKDAAGQTAANIENATRICDRDRRIFQDGIFITKKEKGRGLKKIR